jgi:hypothetical protein
MYRGGSVCRVRARSKDTRFKVVIPVTTVYLEFSQIASLATLV